MSRAKVAIRHSDFPSIICYGSQPSMSRSMTHRLFSGDADVGSLIYAESGYSEKRPLRKNNEEKAEYLTLKECVFSLLFGILLLVHIYSCFFFPYILIKILRLSIRFRRGRTNRRFLCPSPLRPHTHTYLIFSSAFSHPSPTRSSQGGRSEREMLGL